MKPNFLRIAKLHDQISQIRSYHVFVVLFVILKTIEVIFIILKKQNGPFQTNLCLWGSGDGKL